MTIPYVTVLTAVRNGESFLAATIKSIIDQSFSDWEYIIVDDASEDASVEIVEHFAWIDPRLILLRREVQGGPFAAANTGLHEARGRFVVRIDADDLSPPRRIERQVRFLEERSEFRACISPWQSFTDGRLIPGSLARIPVRPRALRWYLAMRAFASHTSLCVERDALLGLGGYRELPAAQDYRLVSELSLKNWLAVIPEVMAFVRNHPGRVSKTRGDIQVDLAVGVMRDHLRSLGADRWPKQELRDLWLAGHAKRSAVRPGMRALEKWAAAWRLDETLDDDDRRELAYLEWRHRWRFARANAKSDAFAILAALGAGAARYPESIVAGARGRRALHQVVKGADELPSTD